MFSKKWANRSFLLIYSFLLSDVSESLISLKSNEWCEWIAHFAHQKWATMSNSLRLLRGNEWCERIAHFAHQKWANEWIAHFFEQIIRSFLDKKRAIHSEIKWANSKPWFWPGQRKNIFLNFSLFLALKKIKEDSPPWRRLQKRLSNFFAHFRGTVNILWGPAPS